MRIGSTVKVAIRALRRNTMRSILTALGIIIGVGAVIAMISIGNGAKSRVEAQVASLGQNVITVFSSSFTQGGVRSGFGGAATLTPEDADAIRLEVEGIDGVSPELRGRNQILANGLNWQTQILGESPDYPSIRSWPVTQGAMFTDQDVQSLAKVAVVGKTIVDQLYPNEDPIGQTLKIRNLPFKIVGVFRPKGFNINGQDQDDVVVVPYTSYMRRITRSTNVSSILIQAAKKEEMARVQQDVTDVLTQRRKGREPDFMVRNQEEIAEAATATARTMTVFLGITAGISLLVGGIGIMNIMLVSVTERTREIGIRLAIGAHGRDVLLQFLIEAIILSAMGGVLGVTLGVSASQLVSWYYGWPVLVSTASVISAVVFSAAIGVFFGFYPARKAAQLDPIEALRYE